MSNHLINCNCTAVDSDIKHLFLFPGPFPCLIYQLLLRIGPHRRFAYTVHPWSVMLIRIRSDSPSFGSVDPDTYSESGSRGMKWREKQGLRYNFFYIFGANNVFYWFEINLMILLTLIRIRIHQVLWIRIRSRIQYIRIHITGRPWSWCLYLMVSQKQVLTEGAISVMWSV